MAVAAVVIAIIAIVVIVVIVVIAIVILRARRGLEEGWWWRVGLDAGSVFTVRPRERRRRAERSWLCGRQELTAGGRGPSRDGLGLVESRRHEP